MFLYLRMALYFFFPMAAAYGFGSWDDATGNFTIVVNGDTLAQFIATNVSAYALTFGAGRVAKASGGAT